MIPVDVSRNSRLWENRKMMQTLWAVIHGGKIELAEPADLPEGARVLVTLLPEDESRFWADASQTSLATVWDNAEDDAYAQLLEE
jgi:hypothetical protein